MPDNEGGPLPLHEPEVEKASRWLPSLVWVIPLLAALIGAGLLVKSFIERGPTVTVPATGSMSRTKRGLPSGAGWPSRRPRRWPIV